MMENPVKSPIVPPIADKTSENFAALSLVILSKTGETKCILTNKRFLRGFPNSIMGQYLECYTYSFLKF